MSSLFVIIASSSSGSRSLRDGRNKNGSRPTGFFTPPDQGNLTLYDAVSFTLEAESPRKIKNSIPLGGLGRKEDPFEWDI